MEHKLTEDDGRKALKEHLIDKANAARLRYGLYIDTDAILKMLDDRQVVRFPTVIKFDAEPLRQGEFAFPQPLGDSPGDGYCIFIHTCFEDQREIWPLLIAYHLVVINYGEMATSDDAEAFGATLLGLDIEAYYKALCELADSIPPAL